MYRTAEQTAILLALLFKRANVKRARVSERTVRVLSKRPSLRSVFLEALRAALDDFGLHMIELERGGFGLIPVTALDGAQPILAKNFIDADLKTLRKEEKLHRQEKVFASWKEEVASGEGAEGEE